MIKRNVVFLCLILFCITACSTRELRDSYSGSTSQKLLTHSIDDLVGKLSSEEFADYRGKSLFVETHFIDSPEIKQYADRRLTVELGNRFGINVVAEPDLADEALIVFYTSLATDIDNFGVTLPLGYIPGVDQSTELNVLSLEKFHGVSEMYYFIGEMGALTRGKTIRAVVKTDALGLPFITIPLSNVDRSE